ncbi:hypothetical protein [Pseudoneobacillus sp. C159]
MLNNLFKKLTPEQKFWEWFRKNEDKFYQMTQLDREVLFDVLSEQLHKIHEDLAFEFSAEPDQNGIRELVISADGIAELIPYVIKLVNIAPKMERWKITAFRQPMDENIEINFKGYTISANTVYFRYQFSEDGTQLDANLYIDGYEEDLIGAIYLLLDSLVGEYNVMTKLRYLEFEELTDKDQLIPLKEISKIINE